MGWCRFDLGFVCNYQPETGTGINIKSETKSNELKLGIALLDAGSIKYT
jgi:hypothetical protein